MRRKVRVIALVASAAALALTLALAGSGPVSSQTPPARTTLVVFETPQNEFVKGVNEEPVDDEGAGEADWSVSTRTLLNPDTCRRVGQNVARVTTVRELAGDDAWYILDATTVLGRNRLTIYGAERLSNLLGENGARHAVTGGTGIYKDVSGEVLVQPTVLCGQEGTLYTFDLLVA